MYMLLNLFALFMDVIFYAGVIHFTSFHKVVIRGIRSEF